MNCILLNNEFNLKELQWLLNTMQTPPPPNSFIKQDVLFLGILRWILYLDLERSEATTWPTDVLQRFDLYQSIKEFPSRS